MIQELPHLAADMRILNSTPRFTGLLQLHEGTPGGLEQGPLVALLRLAVRTQGAAAGRAECQAGLPSPSGRGVGGKGQLFATVGAKIQGRAIPQFAQEHKLKMRQARARQDARLAQVSQSLKRLVEQACVRIVVLRPVPQHLGQVIARIEGGQIGAQQREAFLDARFG